MQSIDIEDNINNNKLDLTLLAKEKLLVEAELVAKNTFSDYPGAKSSLFVHTADWSGEGRVPQRTGFIEPIGFVTRVTSREGILGERWESADNIALNDRQDVLPPADQRGVRSNPGVIHWAGGETIYNLTTEEDRMCSMQSKHDQTQLIAQIVPFMVEPEVGGCFPYVCAENTFVTHAPYMATSMGNAFFEVWQANENGVEQWREKDLAKWWKGDPTKKYTFGRFDRRPIRIVVPKDATLIWQDKFIQPLTEGIAKITSSFTAELNKFTFTCPLQGFVVVKNGQVTIHFEIINFEIVLGECGTTLTPWPIHALANRVLISGAIENLETSPISEVAVFQQELARYRDSCAQVVQAKTWAIWTLERVVEMYTALRTGVVTENSPFIVRKIDYSKVYRPKANKIMENLSKGSGFAVISGNTQWDALCESMKLKGVSTSPMPVANCMQYNRFVYGKSFGTGMGHIDNLFLYDYGGDWTMPAIRKWIAGMGQRIAEVHSTGEDCLKSCIEATCLSYEFVRAKKRYEDNMRRSGVHLTNVCSWKDLTEMLHYRVIDAVFLKSTTTSSMDDEAYYVIGFATVMHDLTDYGYDLSVCDCSNMLFTLGARDGQYSGIEHAYAVTLAGVKYVADVHRYNASGLTLISTHYWQLCNGRHRILNAAMSVAEHAHPRRLAVKDTLIGTIFGRNDEEYFVQPHDHQSCENQYKQLKERALKLGGAFDTLLRGMVARVYERIYGLALDDIVGLEEVDTIVNIVDCVCVDGRNEGIEFLWDMAMFMWGDSGIMWHAFLGSLLVTKDRLVGDDTAGYGYEGRPWEKQQ
ncbi:hypothetical protein SAMD00019534_031320 [Acytostelium subglobosum LB1]|uniref:hypothetical protein n=1 Tax=Acytostelium subglobosum LB1 TaxID=1410327 RepID=UPI000644A64E|nr:hypothetical protein SAMD00019534_031320 [Acytostelium subglobosum LB1]GAM19957.1 hypothetical protein SAMD00019534_031320 [Acytostelium subglobosum LB1]|eukprot:XP_012756719.1 hypothetical protein SAMD00019534_031320 [Acytostelium subglobosum LB1]